MNPPRVYTCSPFWTPFPLPSPYHPSGSSQCTSPKHPVSCIEPGLAIRFMYDIIHVSMPFSQIIPPSPTESKRLFYTSVSLLLSLLTFKYQGWEKLEIRIWIGSKDLGQHKCRGCKNAWRKKGIVISCLSRLMFLQQKGVSDSWQWGLQRFPARRFLLEIRNICWSWMVQIFYWKTKSGTLPNSLGQCSRFAVHPGGYLVSLFLLKYCEAFIKMLNAPQTRLLGNQISLGTFSCYCFLLEYNWFTILLVSAVQWSESAMCIHISPAHPSRSSQNTELSSLCCTAASH